LTVRDGGKNAGVGQRMHIDSQVLHDISIIIGKLVNYYTAQKEHMPCSLVL
jgi:hypothetical protein